jgi:hypothetical protein
VGAIAGTAATARAGRNSSGTYSLPYGPVVSGTQINSTWANTTMSDLASALTSSLDRSGRGPMLSPLQCVDGSASFPGLTFTNDPTMGLARLGANRIGVSIAGTTRLEQNASGLIESGWLQVAGTTTVGGAATFSSTLTSGVITAPSVTSSGAKLSLGAPSTFDTEISASTVVGFAVKADGTNDNKSRRIVNVADPASAQDAATKAYVDLGVAGAKSYTDGKFAFPTLTAPSLTAAWTAGTGEAAIRYWKDSAGMVHFLGEILCASASATITTLPAGYRPKSLRTLFGWDISGGVIAPITIAADGTVSSWGTPTVGRTYRTDGVYFLAEQ